MKRVAVIIGEENLQKAFEDLWHVMINLREYTKEYEHRYGSVAKSYKKYWAGKADKLIEDIENGVYSPLYRGEGGIETQFKKNIDKNLETNERDANLAP